MSSDALDSIFKSFDPPSHAIIYHSPKPKIFRWAKSMRKRPTKAESVLRKIIQNGVCGFRFKNQFVIGGFIADFACPTMKLIVEVDGASHKNRKGYDKARTDKLFSMGWTVIRFSNEQVMLHPTEVIETMQKVTVGLAGYNPSIKRRKWKKR